MTKDPSPRQIRSLCEQIRQGWSEREEAKRTQKFNTTLKEYRVTHDRGGASVFEPLD